MSDLYVDNEDIFTVTTGLSKNNFCVLFFGSCNKIWSWFVQNSEEEWHDYDLSYQAVTHCSNYAGQGSSRSHKLNAAFTRRSAPPK